MLWVLYEQIWLRKDLPELWQLFLLRFTAANEGWLIAALLLVAVNWGIETEKWRLLMLRAAHIPFWQAFKAVLAGVTFAVFTPNRIGEYGGRLLMVRVDKWQTFIATVVSSVSQMIVLIGVGSIGAMGYVVSRYALPAYWLWSGAAAGAVGVTLLLMLYFNIDLIIPLIARLPYLRRGVKHLTVLQEYSTARLVRVLLLSAARYSVYSLQYYLLLRFFGIEVSVIQGFTYIAFLFFLQTVLPLPPVSALLLRGELAVQVWGTYSHNPLSIFAVSFGLWFINLALPAIFGMIFIMSSNVTRNLGYDD